MKAARRQDTTRHIEMLKRFKVEGGEEERKRGGKMSYKKEMLKAERLYREWELDYYEISLEDFLRSFGVRPVFKELWGLAKACGDVWGCYRMLAYLKLGNREDELQLVREAERVGADVEMVVRLLYQGKTKEAAKLIKRL